MQAISMIHLYLADDVMIDILNETFSMAIWTEAQEDVYSKITHQHSLLLEVILPAVDE